MSPERFNRIEFRSVGWEEINMDSGLTPGPTLDRDGTMREKTIPKNE
jgi:hypothetical protein